MTEKIKREYDSVCYVVEEVKKHLPGAEIYVPKIENYGIDDFVMTYKGKKFLCEVKRVRKSYKHRHHFDVLKNTHFKEYPEEALDKRVWILNSTDKIGRPAKYHKIINAEHSCFFYLFYDGILAFSKQALIDATIGNCKYNVSHTTTFEDRTVSDEDKVMIDLDKGTWYQCDPDMDLFLLGNESN